MIRFRDFEESRVSVAAFSEKRDGNLGVSGARDAAAVLDSRVAFCRVCGVTDGDLVTAHQVHGNRVLCVGEGGRAAVGVEEADALVTGVPGLPLGIFVADCVPVYLAACGKRAAGLVHAGRRGILSHIIERTLETFERELGVCPSDVHALIGPSAGPCCYEVSPEIAGDFARAGLAFRGRYVDLWGSCRAQLSAAGVPSGQIAVAGWCTICDPRFFSYRREAAAERNMALLML